MRSAEVDDSTKIECHLGALLEERSMTLVELSDKVGISVAILSVLKSNRAKAIRFSTLQEICRVLNCDVGEMLSYSQR